MKKYPALGYRFPVMVNFESYSERALLDLAVKIFLEKGYELDVECRRELTEAVFELDAMKDMILKNGLMVKQLVDNIARAQSVRAYDLKLDKDAMNRVDVDDIRKGSEKFIRKNV